MYSRWKFIPKWNITTILAYCMRQHRMHETTPYSVFSYIWLGRHGIIKSHMPSPLGQVRWKVGPLVRCVLWYHLKFKHSQRTCHGLLVVHVWTLIVRDIVHCFHISTWTILYSHDFLNLHGGPNISRGPSIIYGLGGPNIWTGGNKKLWVGGLNLLWLPNCGLQSSKCTVRPRAPVVTPKLYLSPSTHVVEL